MKKHKLFIYLTLVSILLIGFKIQIDKEQDLVRFVDPFIGSGGHGHVFVGANVPFGGVQVGPTNFNKGWDWSSSYHYSDSIVKGFCHLNVSGTGMSDLGELTIMPANGELKINAGTQNNHMKGYSSLYSKDKEKVSPGFYSVFLDRYGITVDLTATERSGLHKYSFPKSERSRVIIDLGEGSADRPTETYLRKVNDTLFEGYRFSKGWASDQREFFSLIISKPVKEFILYDGGRKIKKDEAKGKYVKGFLEFSTDKGETVYVKMGVSNVSMKNGLENLLHEIPDWNFDKVHQSAIAKWNNELSKIKIETTDPKKKNWGWYFLIFYVLASICHGFYDFWLINSTARSFSFITFIWLLASMVLWVSVLNNCLNNSYNKKIIWTYNPDKLNSYLLFGLSAIFLLEYFMIGWRFNAEVANLELTKNLSSVLFLFIFLTIKLSKFDVIPNYWAPLKFCYWNTLFSIPRVETKTFNLDQIVGSKVKIENYGEYGILSKHLPVEGEVVKLELLSWEKDWYLIKLETPLNVAWKKQYFLFLKTKDANEIFLHRKKQPVQVRLVNKIDDLAKDRKLKRDFLFVDLALVSKN